MIIKIIIYTYISVKIQSGMSASTDLIQCTDYQTHFPLNITALPVPSFPDVYADKSTFVLSVYLVMSALSIPGNILTIIVLCNARKIRRKPINMILTHQAFADLMVGVVILTEEILDTQDYMDTVPFVCQFFISRIASGTCMILSYFNITFLSLERHSAIVHPLEYNPDAARKVYQSYLRFIYKKYILCLR